jgi:hypothetical protein
MSSAAEAELGALFINAKTAVSMRQTLEEMGHPQPQGQYRFYCRPGMQNLADYWTKHHPASHHKSFRPQILTLWPVAVRGGVVPRGGACRCRGGGEGGLGGRWRAAVRRRRRRQRERCGRAHGFAPILSSEQRVDLRPGEDGSGGSTSSYANIGSIRSGSVGEVQVGI